MVTLDSVKCYTALLGLHRRVTKKAVLKGGTTKSVQLHQPLAASEDAAPQHILSEVGRKAQPQWDYSCESWSRTDFSVTSFMLTA